MGTDKEGEVWPAGMSILRRWSWSHERLDVPLVEEVAEGVDDIGLAEFRLDEVHDVGEVGLAAVCAVDNGHGSGREQRVPGGDGGHGFVPTGLARTRPEGCSSNHRPEQDSTASFKPSILQGQRVTT
jgi:hypothetical protein